MYYITKKKEKENILHCEKNISVMCCCEVQVPLPYVDHKLYSDHVLFKKKKNHAYA